MNVMIPSRIARPRLCCSARAAFTLTEILVAVAIISVLAVILMPATRNATQHANASRSLANLRQIGVLMGSWLGDQDQMYPYTQGPSLGTGNTVWANALLPYLGESSSDSLKKVFICPAETKHSGISDYAANNHILVESSGKQVRSASIPKPSQVAILVTGKLSLGGGAYQGYWSMDAITYVSNPKSTGRTPAARLAGKVGLLFADGHVEQMAPEDVETNRATIFKP